MIKYFTAAWCQPCKQTLPLVLSLAKKLGVEVEVIDIDANFERAQSEGVTSVPTIDYIYPDGDEARLHPPFTAARITDFLEEMANK